MYSASRTMKANYKRTLQEKIGLLAAKRLKNKFGPWIKFSLSSSLSYPLVVSAVNGSIF